MSRVPHRFTDTGETLYDFIDEFLVVCPRCGGCARVVPRQPEQTGLFAPRRLVCGGCACVREWEAGTVRFGVGEDPYLGLSLRLRAPCCGETLWAYNERHFRFLEEFVRAGLRESARDPERGWKNRSLVNRLPGWMKDRKNRDAVLKTIAHLRQAYLVSEKQ